jgi:hypothetical protein
MRMSRAYKAANPRNPAAPASPLKNASPGASTARWNSGRSAVSSWPLPVSGPRREQRRGEREGSAAEPGEAIAAGVEQPLPQRGPDRDAEVERKRVVAQRLTESFRRGEIGQRLPGRHEEHRFGHPQQDAQQHQHGQLGGEDVSSGHDGEEQSAGEQQRASPATVRQPARVRAQHQRRHAERTDHDPHTCRASGQRSGGV